MSGRDGAASWNMRATSGLFAHSQLTRPSMRGGVVAAGVVLMVLGAFLLFFAPQVATSASNSGSGFSFGGINIVSTAFFGIVIGFIGFLVFIAGLAASPTPEASRVVYSQPPPTPPPSAYPVWLPAANPAPATSRSTSSQPPTPPPNTRPAELAGGSVQEASPPSIQSGPSGVTRASGAGASDTVGSSRFCPYCGATTRAEYKFCRSCGKEAPPE